MLRICIHALLRLLAFQIIGCSFAIYWYKFVAATEAACALNNVKLLSLLNLLCNTTQTTSIQMRDACYGCFFRAGSIINGPTQLSSLNDCARLYILQSEYSSCAINLQALVDGNRPTADNAGYCFTGYCDFVRCIRRINAQQLIANCYRESLGTRELEEDLDRIYFYTNVTSCILARSRCSQYNPITGELQNPYFGALSNTFISKKTPATSIFNSLQISASGDIRIISFPALTSVSDLFCTRLPTLQQSGYGTYNC